jgi:hypothetical protein
VEGTQNFTQEVLDVIRNDLDRNVGCTDWLFSWFSSPSKQIPKYYVEVGHYCLFINAFQIAIYWWSNHSTLCMMR